MSNLQKLVRSACTALPWRPSRLWESVCTTCAFQLQYLVRCAPVPGWLQLCQAPRSVPPLLAVLLVRGQKASLEVQWHKEELKQLSVSEVFWQSLRNKKFFLLPFNPPHFSAVNSGEHLRRKTSSPLNPVLCKAAHWHFLQGPGLCKLCKLEQVIRISSNDFLENLFSCFLTHFKNKGQTKERKPKCSESPLAIFFIYIWTICWNKCPKTKTGGNRGMFFGQ